MTEKIKESYDCKALRAPFDKFTVKDVRKMFLEELAKNKVSERLLGLTASLFTRDGFGAMMRALPDDGDKLSLDVQRMIMEVVLSDSWSLQYVWESAVRFAEDDAPEERSRKQVLGWREDYAREGLLPTTDKP